MKTHIHARKSQRAFTLTEIMVTAALGLMVVGGMISAHMAGLRIFQVTKTKLGGTDDARAALSKVVEEIRTAKLVRIGAGTGSSFTECAVNAQQRGNSIQIYPTMATNVWIRYYLDTDNCLHRRGSGSASTPIIASYVTNSYIFSSEDFQGNVLTNNENNRVIGLTLQFYQIQYPIVKIGTNQLYDYYQISTRVTRRAFGS